PLHHRPHLLHRVGTAGPHGGPRSGARRGQDERSEVIPPDRGGRGALVRHAPGGVPLAEYHVPRTSFTLVGGPVAVVGGVSWLALDRVARQARTGIGARSGNSVPRDATAGRRRLAFRLLRPDARRPLADAAGAVRLADRVRRNGHRTKVAAARV